MPLLHDLPETESDAWLSQYSVLMQDAWLRKKLSRTRRLGEHLNYLFEYAPEVFVTNPPGLVIDFGPGAGELLEIGRMLGFRILGVDAKTGAGGMGDNYLDACRLIVQRQNLPVRYCGAEHFMSNEALSPDLHGSAVLINSRGSIEQMFSRLMDGPRHHLHQDCRKLRWQENPRTQEALEAFLWRCKQLLTFGGVLLVAANGSANLDWYDGMICRAAAEVGGLRLLVHHRRIHKWVKEAA
jgi:hypothetical protein